MGQWGETTHEHAQQQLGVIRLNTNHKLTSHDIDYLGLHPSNLKVAVSISNHTPASANPEKYKDVKTKYICTYEAERICAELNQTSADIKIVVAYGRVVQEEDMPLFKDNSINLICIPNCINTKNMNQEVSNLAFHLQTVYDFYYSQKTEDLISLNTVSVNSLSIGDNVVSVSTLSYTVSGSLGVSSVSSSLDSNVASLGSDSHNTDSPVAFSISVGNYVKGNSSDLVCHVGTSNYSVNNIEAVDNESVKGFMQNYISRVRALSAKLGVPLQTLLPYYTHPKRRPFLEALVKANDEYVKLTFNADGVHTVDTPKFKRNNDKGREAVAVTKQYIHQVEALSPLAKTKEPYLQLASDRECRRLESLQLIPVLEEQYHKLWSELNYWNIRSEYKPELLAEARRVHKELKRHRRIVERLS